MNGMRRCLLGPLVSLSFSACAIKEAAPPARWTAVDSARVQAVLAPLIRSREFMGAVAFVRDGEMLHAQGAGVANVAAARAFAPGTPADGGSLAKTLTAAAVWTLVHERRIAIDTPVIVYVADFPHAATTVRQLIAHTNGLSPYYEEFDSYFGPQTVRTTEGLLAVVRRAMPQPRFAPGTRFEYSNLGFDAAALVVERVTGQPIATFFRQRFFAPFGMDSAFARPGRFTEFRAPRTLGYRWVDTGWAVSDVFDNEAFIGGSNVYFSVLDLAGWASAHASGTALPPAVRALGEPRPMIDGHRSPINGLSWYCDGAGERCQYSGANNAFHSLAYWDRARGEAVAMVSNSSLAPWTLITLQRDLVAVLAAREPDRSPRPPFVKVDKGQRREFVGRYARPEGDTLTVSDSGDGFRLRIGRGLEFDVFQVAPEEFYVPGLDYFMGFAGEAKARRLHARSMFEDFVAFRTP